jgi:hypothetical protein
MAGSLPARVSSSLIIARSVILGNRAFHPTLGERGAAGGGRKNRSRVIEARCETAT